MKTVAIVNPKSAGGKTGRLWKQLSPRLGNPESRFTSSPNHATALARDLLKQNYDRIIAVGGDGTVNEVVNGFLADDKPLRPEADLAILPLGTGSDFQRSVGLLDIEQAIGLIRSEAPSVPSDAGRIRYRGPSGDTRLRYFANLVSFGMGGEVAAGARNVFRLLSGKAAFLFSTARVFVTYRSKEVRLTLDGRDVGTWRVTNIAIGNGRYHGGGMHICPRAALDDGSLDVSVVEQLSAYELARDVKVLYSDDVYVHPKVHHFRGARVEAASEEAVAIEVDGEPLGSLPVEIAVLPGVLRLVRPPAVPATV